MGAVAGSYDKKGYIRIGVLGRYRSAARIIWEMHHGPIPVGLHIDHINGIKDDDRIENLRPVTATQNNLNRGRRRTNRCGLKGTHQLPSGGWRSQIQDSGEKMNLGIYDTPEEAHEAYKAKAIELHGEFARFS